MENEEEVIEDSLKAISPKAFGKFLDTKAETLRNYALALEKAGYTFSKSEGGHRRYIQDDFAIFNILKSHISNGLPVEQAAAFAVKQIQQQAKPAVVPQKNRSSSETNLAKNESGEDLAAYDARYAEIAAKLALLDRIPQLEEQLRRQDERLEKIEAQTSQFGVSELAKALHEIQKSERIAAAAAEKNEIEKEKRGLIASIFSIFKKRRRKSLLFFGVKKGFSF
ncbi:hypothetical protein PUW24_26490 (plasmid) [Paenibacillus urinalis]|uniref:hypothetical protein n=1 Tax=Paenibacillus urinalis TaxID=521520 RepID=UPI002368DDD2|nr:hypothetical protein [Paenibacillus urinalis]WDI00131.1 hypothetical protein PUW24_26490 [Paenibacillus urinalis]